VTIHGRTAEQSYKGVADWELVARVADDLHIPVLGSGDCVEPEQILERLGSADGSGVRHKGIDGILVGRGVLRNPWILAQAEDMARGRPVRHVTMRQRGEFLLDYVELLLHEGVDERVGFRHIAPQVLPGPAAAERQPARGRNRWVINKVRALCSWYSKGFDGGSQFRVRVNSCQSIAELRDIIEEFFPAVAPLQTAGR
jgi:tRNA-dihydrouridine synthase